jgi:hypothetical protein
VHGACAISILRVPPGARALIERESRSMPRRIIWPCASCCRIAGAAPGLLVRPALSLRPSRRPQAARHRAIDLASDPVGEPIKKAHSRAF